MVSVVESTSLSYHDTEQHSISVTQHHVALPHPWYPQTPGIGGNVLLLHPEWLLRIHTLGVSIHRTPRGTRGGGG